MSASRLPSELDKPALLVREEQPPNLETPAAHLDSWLTPTTLFFVRTHVRIPRVDVGKWRLVVHGQTERPLSLSIDDLRRLPRRSVVATLECSGNGRIFWQPRPAGVPWARGAIGTARWTGVPLSTILAQAGVSERARHVVCEGADEAAEGSEKFVRSLPLDKALDPDTLLAFDMNDAPLPVPHGHPLRLVVPGWAANHSLKWMTHLRLQPEPHDGYFMTQDYRVPAGPAGPGGAATREIRGLGVKAMVTRPSDGDRVASGPLPIAGVALSGDGAVVVRVEVSIDDGARWHEAVLSEERAPYAWRLWQVTLDVPAGEVVIRSRATDDRGRVQPEQPPWNAKGYLWNGWDRVRIDAHGRLENEP